MCDLVPLTAYLQIADYVFENGGLVEVDYGCDRGQLQGNKTLLCGDDGQWSSELPTCVCTYLVCVCNVQRE